LKKHGKFAQSMQYLCIISQGQLEI